jgi:hypothetical protein
MIKKFTFLFVMVSIAYLGSAQVQKLTDAKYYMYFKPVIGSLRGSSDLTRDINPNFTLESRGLLMGIDWVSGRWTEVDEALVPKIQVPIKIRYMGAKDMKGLKINDGTCFPEEPGADPKDNPRKPFDYLDFSFDLYYSPISFKFGSTVLTPKIGIDIDLARHEYDIDVSKFLGKEGTYANLQADINNSYSSFYSYAFWEDILGFNAGLYINLGKRVFVDLGYEYYPVRLMTKQIGNSINTNWDAMPGTAASESTRISKFNIEGQFRIVSWFSAFARYEYANYKYSGPHFVTSGDFYQKYSNLMFGVTLGGPKMDF